MRRLLTWIAVFVACLILAPEAWAAQGDPGGSTVTDLTVTLAPLIAAATAIERLLEWFFNWLESAYNGIFVSALGGVVGWYRWAQDEWQAAYDGLQAAAEKLRALRGAPEPDTNEIRAWVNKTREFEAQLLAAETRLQGLTKSPRYLQIKQGIAVLVGLGLGVTLSFSADLKMFSMMGVGLASGLEFWDRLITGLAIGTGSQPVHSLISLLQQGHEALGRLRDMWQRRGELLRVEAAAGSTPPSTMVVSTTGETLPSPDYARFQRQGLR
jgi:hypothetical protein